jgi:hypothetical protein
MQPKIILSSHIPYIHSYLHGLFIIITIFYFRYSRYAYWRNGNTPSILAGGTSTHLYQSLAGSFHCAPRSGTISLLLGFTLHHKSLDMPYGVHDKLVKTEEHVGPSTTRQARRHPGTAQLRQSREASSYPSFGMISCELKASVVG